MLNETAAGSTDLLIQEYEKSKGLVGALQRSDAEEAPFKRGFPNVDG